jgi:hypothetical protein
MDERSSQDLPATEYAPVPPVIIGGDVNVDRTGAVVTGRHHTPLEEKNERESHVPRQQLGLATATFFGLAAASPAACGGFCCGSNWGWGGGFGEASAAAAVAAVYAYQPQYVLSAAPILCAGRRRSLVQAPPQQIIVQQHAARRVIFQQAAYAPVPRYTVDQGRIMPARK